MRRPPVHGPRSLIGEAFAARGVDAVLDAVPGGDAVLGFADRARGQGTGAAGEKTEDGKSTRGDGEERTERHREIVMKSRELKSEMAPRLTPHRTASK
jgi:hypothetical protein